MRQSVVAVLLAASLAGGATSVMAQDTEGLSVAASIVAPSALLDLETYALDLRGEDEARDPCASCAILDGDDSSMNDTPPCTLSSGWASDECLAGIDRGGHSKGKYL